ncbi:MAG: GAF and ANTAR domain-containing protein [Nocardioides sp.]|nr:GAF and ANTAR domain-containing protein [Nocardioides sp.]
MVHPDRTGITEALASAARTMRHETALEETLQAVVESACASVPGFDAVGISTIARDRTVTTQAASGDIVQILDTLQYSLREGPCVDALYEVDLLEVPHVRHDQRWPRYVPAAVEVGLRAQMALKLYLDDQGTLGTMNFYSTEAEEIHPDAGAIADLFAAHAAVVLGHAREQQSLGEALATRQVIGQAVGIVMERYGLSDSRAFDFLVRTSSTSNIKLRVIATELVREGDEPTSDAAAVTT